MILSKSVKSQGILFYGLQFISLPQEFEMHFLLEKMKSMLQSKQSDQYDTLCLTRDSCGQWFSLLIVSSKFLFPLSAKSGKSFPMLKKNDKFSVLGMYNMALAKKLCASYRGQKITLNQSNLILVIASIKAFILQSFRRNSGGGFTESSSKNVVNLKILL